jgi:hypothetical protein
MSGACRTPSRLALAVAAVAVVGGGCKERSVAPGSIDGGSLADAGTDLGAGGSVGTGGAGGSIGTGGAGAGGGPCTVEAPAGGTVFEGSITINNAADATAAQAYTGITGSLVMGVGFAGAVDLPRLRTVGGDVFAEGGGLTNLRAPNLTSIGNDLWIYLVTTLVEVDLRSVVTAGGRLWVYRNPKLATLRLDALRQVAEDVQIRDDTPLAACVVDDIASHVTAGMTIVALGTPHPDCHCETVCSHAEERCP